VLLMKDPEGSAKAMHAHTVSNAVEGLLNTKDDGLSPAYVLGANIKLANEVGRDGAPMLAGIRKQVQGVPKDAQGSYILEERTKKDMNILFGEGEWTNEHVGWIKQLNETAFGRIVEMDDSQRLQLVDKVEQLSYADNAKTYYDYAESAIKAKQVDFPDDIEDYLGRRGKVFNVNTNQFMNHPDDDKRLTTKPVEENGYAVAQDMVDYYSQQALYDVLTKETMLTFAKSQVELADKGIIPAPNPKDYEESVVKTKLGKTIKTYKPKEDMMARSWEVAQNAGAQVLSHAANMSYGKVAPDQYLHEGLKDAMAANAKPGDMGHNLELLENKMHAEATTIDPDGTVENPGTHLTHLKLAAEANFGKRDTRLFKKGLDPKIVAGAAFVAMLGGGLIISQIEGLDAHFS
jgi:hypothetical protein